MVIIVNPKKKGCIILCIIVLATLLITPAFSLEYKKLKIIYTVEKNEDDKLNTYNNQHYYIWPYSFDGTTKGELWVHHDGQGNPISITDQGVEVNPNILYNIVNDKNVPLKLTEDPESTAEKFHMGVSLREYQDFMRNGQWYDAREVANEMKNDIEKRLAEGDISQNDMEMLLHFRNTLDQQIWDNKMKRFEDNMFTATRIMNPSESERITAGWLGRGWLAGGDLQPGNMINRWMTESDKAYEIFRWGFGAKNVLCENHLEYTGYDLRTEPSSVNVGGRNTPFPSSVLSAFGTRLHFEDTSTDPKEPYHQFCVNTSTVATYNLTHRNLIDCSLQREDKEDLYYPISTMRASWFPDASTDPVEPRGYFYKFEAYVKNPYTQGQIDDNQDYYGNAIQPELAADNGVINATLYIECGICPDPYSAFLNYGRTTEFPLYKTLVKHFTIEPEKEWHLIGSKYVVPYYDKIYIKFNNWRYRGSDGQTYNVYPSNYTTWENIVYETREWANLDSGGTPPGAGNGPFCEVFGC